MSEQAQPSSIRASAAMSPHSRYALGLLTSMAILHTFDRIMISVLIEPMKAEFQFSDTQIGLLTGVLFGLFYTTAGVPIARIADRWNRPYLLACCLGIWTAMTALCGLAATATQLVLCRIGVAIGEAGFTPIAQALIADQVPPARRAGALAILGAGGAAGVMIGLLASGFLTGIVGWRWTFILIGGLGVPVALLAAFTLREPRHAAPAPTGGQTGMLRAIRALFADRVYVLLVIAGTIAVLTTYAIAIWTPAVMVRDHGISAGRAGVLLGFSVGFASVVGFLLGGYLGNRVSREKILLFTIGAFIISPFLYAAALMAPSVTAAVIILSIPTVLGATWYAAVFTAIHERVSDSNRALAVATAFFVIGIAGNGLGPTSAGAISDWLRPLAAEASLKYALMIVVSTQFLAAAALYLAHRLRNRGSAATLDG